MPDELLVPVWAAEPGDWLNRLLAGRLPKEQWGTDDKCTVEQAAEHAASEGDVELADAAYEFLEQKFGRKAGDDPEGGVTDAFVEEIAWRPDGRVGQGKVRLGNVSSLRFSNL